MVLQRVLQPLIPAHNPRHVFVIFLFVCIARNDHIEQHGQECARTWDLSRAGTCSVPVLQRNLISPPLWRYCPNFENALAGSCVFSCFAHSCPSPDTQFLAASQLIATHQRIHGSPVSIQPSLMRLRGGLSLYKDIGKPALSQKSWALLQQGGEKHSRDFLFSSCSCTLTHRTRSFWRRDGLRFVPIAACGRRRFKSRDQEHNQRCVASRHRRQRRRGRRRGRRGR